MTKHVLIAKCSTDCDGWPDDCNCAALRVLIYNLECPHRTRAARMKDCSSIEPCGCGPTPEWHEANDDLGVYDWIEQNPECPRDGEDHCEFDGTVMTRQGNCWLVHYDALSDAADELGITEPGRYPVDFTAEDGGEYLHLELAPVEVANA